MNYTALMGDLFLKIKEWIVPALNEMNVKIKESEKLIQSNVDEKLSTLVKQIESIKEKSYVDVTVYHEDKNNIQQFMRDSSESREQTKQEIYSAIKKDIEEILVDINKRMGEKCNNVYDSCQEKYFTLDQASKLKLSLEENTNNQESKLTKLADSVSDQVNQVKDAVLSEIDEKIAHCEENINHVSLTDKNYISEDGYLTSQKLFHKNIDEQFSDYLKSIDFRVALEEYSIDIEKQINDALREISFTAKDGRDGLDIDVLPAINLDKSYVRGTYASHNGGLWRAHTQTDGLRGWDCLIKGFPKIEVNQVDDNNFKIEITDTVGDKQIKDIHIPAMVYREIWKEGHYKKGDCVTWGGSVWYCLKDTDEKPGGKCNDWRLAVKKGSDAKCR